MLLLHAFRAGDPTEDPQHPKIIWPSATDCPNCRTDRMDLFNLDPQIAFVEGQLWNLTRLVEYSIKVYGTEQLAVRPLVVPTSAATANSATVAPRQDETTTMDNIGKLLVLFNIVSRSEANMTTPCEMEFFNFLWLIWDHYIPLALT